MNLNIRYYTLMTRAAIPQHLAAVLTVLLLSVAVFSQPTSVDLPDKIQGYKVHKKVILISLIANDQNDDSNADIKFGDPELIDISLSGITFAVGAEIKAIQQSGSVDMLTFHDLEVNGIPVTIEKYEFHFKFKKNESVLLPEPAKIFLPTGRMMQAAVKEMRDSKDQWTIRGRIFVFGKFKKFGFSHKRAIPVDIDLLIKNPFHNNKDKNTSEK